MEFLSSRELYETSPDSFQHGGSKRGNNTEVLCPRHAKAHLELRQPNTDSRWVEECALFRIAFLTFEISLQQ